MDGEDEDPNRPGTSRGELSECPKESSRLNNNVTNGCDASECCAGCGTTSQQDHMVAASLVYCDQEDNDSDDDCCIYTYIRQETAADHLPATNRSTSPLMDYLEMDFDPEPTVGNESEEEDLNVPDRTDGFNDSLINVQEPTPSSSGVGATRSNEQAEQTISENSGLNETNQPIPELPIIDVKCSSTQNCCKEERNGCVRRNSDTTEICHKLKRMRLDDISWVKEMVWSEKHAAQHQINQIGVSACGATAVVNTLLALQIPFNIDHINRTVGTRLRDETASLVPYLESRAIAGCMPQDLVRTLETVTESLVSARFFATRQDLDTPIAPWLASWIKKGAVPILTLNLQQAQRTLNSLVPDSWHHQMMHGISYDPLKPELALIYLTNPLCQLSMETLRPQLLAPSTLMIRRSDVLLRWSSQTDLMPLATYPNQNWQKFNVLGQVVNVVREAEENIQYTEHIVIPANYKSGITLAIRTSSNYSHELKSVPDL